MSSGKVVLSVPPGETTPPQFVDELFPGLEGRQFSGSLEIQATVPEVAMPIRVEGVPFTARLVHPARTQSGRIRPGENRSRSATAIRSLLAFSA